MIMRVSQDALELLHEFEQGPEGGFAATTYKNSSGVKTIGWGHVRHPGDKIIEPITEEEADDLLRFDLKLYEIAVNNKLEITINQAQFDALTCFAFNVGISSLSHSKLLLLVNQGKFEEAAEQFECCNKVINRHTGERVELADLTRRRAAERALFEKIGDTEL